MNSIVEAGSEGRQESKELSITCKCLLMVPVVNSIGLALIKRNLRKENTDEMPKQIRRISNMAAELNQLGTALLLVAALAAAVFHDLSRNEACALGFVALASFVNLMHIEKSGYSDFINDICTF
jgi:hypothetical protein